MTKIPSPLSAPFARRGGLIATNTVLTVLLLLAVAASVGFGYQWYSAWRDDGMRTEAVDAASKGVLALMSVSPATIDADLAAVEAMATGTFAEEVASGRDIVRERVLDNVVTQDAEVTHAAYAGGDSDSATIIMSVDTVTVYAELPEEQAEEGEGDDAEAADEEEAEEGDDEAAGPRQEHFRVKVEMALVDDQWLISALEIG